MFVELLIQILRLTGLYGIMFLLLTVSKIIGDTKVSPNDKYEITNADEKDFVSTVKDWDNTAEVNYKVNKNYKFFIKFFAIAYGVLIILSILNFIFLRIGGMK